MKSLNKNSKYDREKPPEHQLAVAKIQRMFFDSFNITTSGDYAYTSQRKLSYKQNALRWIRSKELDFWADMIGADADYLRQLHNDMTYNYKCGKLNLKLLKIGINRLINYI